MEDREQKQRERAYKIWEEEGRQEGRDLDHWHRAAEKHQADEDEAADVTQANQEADEAFNNEDGDRAATDLRPPSTSSAD